MELIDQHTKGIMEECKPRVPAEGLEFDDETLEYIFSNNVLLKLPLKMMIPTLYDYWVHYVEVLKDYGKYKLYPINPYETVINSHPAISLYNGDDPDWLNVMIFYLVQGHIDFFQNNIIFQHIWNEDFVGLALSDKRSIESLRNQYGRWVDYVIEFARSIDNIVGFYDTIFHCSFPFEKSKLTPIEYYLEVFLQEEKKAPLHQIFNEIGKYTELIEKFGEQVGENMFFADVRTKYPEFDARFEKYKNTIKEQLLDLLEFINENSPFLKLEKNLWMKIILAIIRNAKILNERWASYWHDELFCCDERIRSHEADYARVNAGVTSISRVGLNPYAIGMRLIQYVEELPNKGKLNYKFQPIENIEERENYNLKTGEGKSPIFLLRKYFSDFPLLNIFITQEFVDMHNLFVVDMNFNPECGTIVYYVKSRKAEDYKKMLLDSLYHPSYIVVVYDKTTEKNLYLRHIFEGKQIIQNYIPDVLVGFEYLWGGQVQLETTQIIPEKPIAERRNQNFVIKKHFGLLETEKFRKQL